MALVVYDRVQETTATTGTGTITLGGAVAGYQSFAVVGNGNTTFYCIVNSNAWEVGIGTYTSAGTTLARTTVLSNSNGNTTPITLVGASNVFVTYPASKSINYDANGVATIGTTLSYSDTGIIGSFASTVAGYNQVIIQNKSTATNASANLNISNDASTSTTGFVELGINSSTFTGSGSFSIAGASYLASASTDLVIGTYGAYNLRFVTNSSTTDSMTIFNNGGISLGGFSNPGIGNISANKFIPGYAEVTSAAGTTVLTAASYYYQRLTGTLAQTFQLPAATTLVNGTTFIFDNDSTGSLTVTDGATTTIDTIPTGGLGYLYLISNATVAGTWARYAMLPSSFDFGTNSANFGGATISNAVWNGTTIAYNYGGTGLTTFTAANYALYSTSASALTAGTLPVAAGGTGMTTATANGVFYGNGTSAHGVTAAGTTGQVLIATTSGAPSWGSVPTTAAVTSLNFGTTGLTPATATTGAITVAGTLVAANGGTGQSSYAVGDLLYASTTTALSKLADVATGNALISGGVGVAPSYGKIGLTTHVSGTLPIANGGTNGTATPTAGAVAYGTGTAYAFNSAGTAGQVLTSQGAGIPTWTTPTTGTVTSVTGTSPVVSSGGNTPAISLAASYGDTQNPYASKTANYFLAAPNGTAGVPTFRAMVAADVPTLNQNTTGTAGGLTGTPNITVGTVNGTTITASTQFSGPGTGLTGTASSLTAGTATNATNVTATTSSTSSAFKVPFLNTTASTTGNYGLLQDSTATFTYNPSTNTVESGVVNASNGLVINSNTVSASYSIPSGSNAMSAGPMTVASGQSVTVPSGSRWVVI